MADGTIDRAISAIETADLTAIEHKILANFVKEAYEPSLAAREVLDRIRDDGRPVEETLRVLKQDWHELVAVSKYLYSFPQVQATTKSFAVSRPTPFDAPFGDLVARRDSSRCRVTPPDRQQLDEPEPTFIIPPALSKLVDGKGAEVLHLILQAVAFNTNAFYVALTKVATGRLHDAVKSGTVAEHGL